MHGDCNNDEDLLIPSFIEAYCYSIKDKKQLNQNQKNRLLVFLYKYLYLYSKAEDDDTEVTVTFKETVLREYMHGLEGSSKQEDETGD